MTAERVIELPPSDERFRITDRRMHRERFVARPVVGSSPAIQQTLGIDDPDHLALSRLPSGFDQIQPVELIDDARRGPEADSRAHGQFANAPRTASAMRQECANDERRAVGERIARYLGHCHRHEVGPIYEEPRQLNSHRPAGIDIALSGSPELFVQLRCSALQDPDRIPAPAAPFGELRIGPLPQA